MNLTENEITGVGITDLAGALRNNKAICTLVLNRNPVGNDGASALAFGMTSLLQYIYTPLTHSLTRNNKAICTLLLNRNP